MRRTAAIALAALLLLSCAIVAAESSPAPCPVHAGAWSSAGQLRSLIATSADVNAGSAAGETVLMLALQFQHGLDVVTALLQAGADVNAKDKLGWTPLHFAASRVPNPEVIRALLNAGADPRAKTDMGKTAFDLAGLNSKIKDTDVYRLLKPDAP